VVKSVQCGVRHNSARSVETMPLALVLHGEIQGRVGKGGPQGRVWSALIVMWQPRPQSFSKMLLVALPASPRKKSCEAWRCHMPADASQFLIPARSAKARNAAPASIGCSCKEQRD
jgi:hypothetical protein